MHLTLARSIIITVFAMGILGLLTPIIKTVIYLNNKMSDVKILADEEAIFLYRLVAVIWLSLVIFVAMALPSLFIAPILSMVQESGGL